MKLRDHDQPCEHEADEFYGGHPDQNYKRGHVVLGPLADGASRWCPGGAEIEVAPDLAGMIALEATAAEEDRCDGNHAAPVCQDPQCWRGDRR